MVAVVDNYQCLAGFKNHIMIVANFGTSESLDALQQSERPNEPIVSFDTAWGTLGSGSRPAFLEARGLEVFILLAGATRLVLRMLNEHDR